MNVNGLKPSASSYQLSAISGEHQKRAATVEGPVPERIEVFGG
jgi:hypothetical protein